MFILYVCLCYLFLVWHCIYPIINFKGIWWYDCNVYLFFVTEISGWRQILTCLDLKVKVPILVLVIYLLSMHSLLIVPKMDAQHNFDQVAFLILCLPFHIY
jgi:hypothetical protein